MAYITDRTTNPIQKNGAFLVANKGFTAILAGQWAEGVPSKDLLDQDSVNEYFASQAGNYNPRSFFVPVIANVSPTSVNATDTGAFFFINATNLRGVKSVTIGGESVPFYSSSKSIQVSVGGIVGNGGLIVVTNEIGSSTSTQSIAVSHVPFAITDFTPKTAKRGDVITITGTRLLLVGAIRAAGARDQYTFTNVSDTQVSFIIDSEAPIGTGVIRIAANGNLYSTSVDLLTIIATPVAPPVVAPPVVVAPIPAPTLTSARIVNLNNGPAMEMIGTDLTGVTKITIGGVLVPFNTITEYGGSTLTIGFVRVVDPTHEAVVVTTGSGSTLPFSNVTIFS